LVRKASAVGAETKWSAWLYHQYNQSILVTDGMTVTSLSASLLQKISVATDRLYQIVLNRKLSHKVEKWCKFSSCFKAKSRKRKSCKMRPAHNSVLKPNLLSCDLALFTVAHWTPLFISTKNIIATG
jgi:hypothetical protein